MESLIQQFIEINRDLIHFAWLPVLIWTIVASITLAMMNKANKIHVQYHYHVRLALITGLPLGLFSAWLIEQIAYAMSVMGAEEASLKVFAVMAPMEIGISTAESASFPTIVDLVYLLAGIAILFGTIWMLGKRLNQWLQLRLLKKQVPFMEITDLDSISKRNIELAQKSGKVIRIACMREKIIPVTFGISDPVILIPETLMHQPEKMNLAIRHELTHILNRDFVTHLSVTCIQSLFWFHPLVHLLSNQLVDYREMRCDSIIISDSTISKKRYASLLFELLPMPNLNRQISVNMAQQSSNLKQRIERITKQEYDQKQPYKSSFTLLATLLVTLIISMACTDFQTQSVFDEEELELMTDVDRTGERGYHQVIIFMSEEEQADRHENTLSKLDQLKPEYIQSLEVLKGEAAIEEYGERGAEGVILIKTNQDPDSYNNTLQALGMEPDMSVFPEAQSASEDQEDYFVVVEEMPELIGGLASIQENIRYPETARNAGVEGRVYIQFIVNEQGDVVDPRVIRGIGGGADEEALRAVRQAKFKPGMQRGRPVRVQYSLPVVFRLQGSNQSGQTQIEPPESRANSMSANISFDGENIRGTLRDEDSGQPLAGANIILEGTNSGTATNSNGEFSISTSNSDATHLNISYVGYTPVSVNLATLNEGMMESLDQIDIVGYN